MIRCLMLVFAMLFLSACATTKSQSGVYRPTLMDFPKTYLKKFPIGAPESEVIQYVGTPDKIVNGGDIKYLTYDISAADSTGVIEYTYEVKDGLVANVTYLNSGNFFGVTQRESAKALQP